MSKEQGPAGPGRGGLPAWTPGVPGSDTVRRASQVSSPSVSRTNSSTLVALMGRSRKTSVAVCRHLCTARGYRHTQWAAARAPCGAPVKISDSGCACCRLSQWQGTEGRAARASERALCLLLTCRGGHWKLRAPGPAGQQCWTISNITSACPAGTYTSTHSLQTCRSDPHSSFGSGTCLQAPTS